MGRVMSFLLLLAASQKAEAPPYIHTLLAALARGGGGAPTRCQMLRNNVPPSFGMVFLCLDPSITPLGAPNG